MTGQVNDLKVRFWKDALNTEFGAYNDLQYLYNKNISNVTASMFSNGEAGAWWDVQDASTLFADTSMTTLAEIDEPVAVHADKSGNGNHRVQATLGNRPILRQRSDGARYLDYAGGKSISVPSSTSTFKFLHDGTGSTICAFIMYPWGTSESFYLQTSPNSVNAGIQMQKTPGEQNLGMRIHRAASGTVANTITIPRVGVSNVPHFIRWSYGSTAMASMDSSISKTEVSNTNAPSSADSGIDLTVMSNFLGHEYEIVIVNRVMTDEEVRSLYKTMKASNAHPVPDRVDYTFLLGGQSNMSGRAEMIIAQPENSMAGVYSYSRADEFALTYIPEHSIVNQLIGTSPSEGGIAFPQHGFVLRMGKSLKTNSGINSLLVPCAVGGTTIAQWNTPETLGDRTTLLGAMKYRYEQATAKGGEPVIMWYGHEGSAHLAVPNYTAGGVGAYKDMLKDLLNTVRSNIVDAPIILVAIATKDDAGLAVNRTAAAEAARLLELEMPNVYLVSAYDVERNAGEDDVHVSRPGMNVIADRAALAVREHILGEHVNGTGPRLVNVSYKVDVVTVTFDKEVQASATNYDDLFRVYANGTEVTVTTAVRDTDTSKIILTCASKLATPLTVTYGYRAGVPSAARTDIVKDTDDIPAPVFGPLLEETPLGPELITDQQTTLDNASGGAVVVHDPVLRSVEITTAGSQIGYPRLNMAPGLTAGKTYRVSGVIAGSPGILNSSVPVRLHTLGSTPALVTYNSTTGVFNSDAVAASNAFQVVINGTNTGTVTITNLSIREVL